MPIRKPSEDRAARIGRPANSPRLDHNNNNNEAISTSVHNPVVNRGRLSIGETSLNTTTTTPRFRFSSPTAIQTIRPPTPSTVAPRNTGVFREHFGVLRTRSTRPYLRPPPPVMTESSEQRRRNRITLIASRRRTTLATSQLNNSQAATTTTTESPNSFNGTQRFSLSSYANSLAAYRDHTLSPSSIARSKVTFSFPNLEQGPVSKVLEGSEKYLPKIFRFLNWNELLPMRSVCKKWLEIISSESCIEARMGVITIRNPWQDKLQVFNNSPVIWTKFRILANIFIDLMDSVQLQFWMKHGPKMKYLEIKNNSMTLTGLVEILSRCPNLEHFLVTWTAEMYPFNSELIKKYYGINFYNGTFASMQNLTVERSCYLTDNALLSMLKWCGGPLKSLSLTYPPENLQDPLTRLKPRWTIEPLKNYFERFGYTGNLQNLNFSWSNINAEDLIALGNIDQLTSLKEITLSHCKINDKSLSYFLSKKGRRLEQLHVDDVPITEVIFANNPTPHLRALNISGGKGNFKNLTFLPHLHSLETLSAANTTWLDYNKLMPPLKTKVLVNPLRNVDIGGNMKVNGTKQIDTNMNRVWFSNLATALTNVVNLNLNNWGHFGRNENFRMICQKLIKLEELRLRGWRELSDSGVTGLADKLHNPKNVIMSLKEKNDRIFIGSLKNLHVLDLSDCSITDASIKYGINFVPYLRKFYFDNTEVSDVGVNIIINTNQSIDRISFNGCDKIVVQKLKKFQRPDGRYLYADKF